MNRHVKKIRQAAKKFISYDIEGEDKVYRLKHTPFRIKDPYTRMYHEKLEPLPIVSNKIVFDNYMGKGYGCNGKYVTEALLESGTDLDIVWTVKNAKEQRRLFPKELRLVEYGSPEAMKEYATALVWASNFQMVHYLNKGLLKKPEQIYIQMWHGSFGIKKIENDCKSLTADKNWVILAQKNSRYTDYWISNSQFETEVYKQAFWDVTSVLEYGHPRNDIFFDGRQERARLAVEKHIGKKNCRILLYVPTFRDNIRMWEQPLDYGRLKQSMEGRFGGEWQILMRMHPRMKEYADAVRGDGCMDVTDYPDIQELLAAADAVITDYSSAVFDFLLTGRPAFLYATDYSAYEQMRGLYYPLEKAPFPLASDNRQLAEKIASFDGEAYRAKVKEFLEGKRSVEDGNAAKRVSELILSSIKQYREKQR